MKQKVILACTLLLATASMAPAQEPARDSPEQGIPITELIEAVAKKSGKRFVIDPRVRARVLLVSQTASQVSYADLLSMLQVHGFTAVESGGYVRVIPDAVVRMQPVPLALGNTRYADAEYVSRVITVRNLPAAMLVPVLRPLIPQQGHLVAFTCSNQLLIVDTFGNIKRVEELVKTVDVGEPYKPAPCRLPDPRATGEKATEPS